MVKRVARNQVARIEDAYQRVYELDAALASREDLETRWNAVRGPLEKSLAVVGVEAIPSSSLGYNRRFRKLQKLIHKDIAALRKSKG